MTGVPATITLLSGDTWSQALHRDLRTVTTECLVSMYLISRHWGSLGRGDINLMADLLKVPSHCHRARCILGNPATIRTREAYNTDAALQLREAGWQVKFGPENIPWHEKLIIMKPNIVYVGSHNISVSSMVKNIDTTVRIADQTTWEAAWKLFWQHWRLCR